MSGARSARRAGLTLVEVVVSSAILSLIALAIMAANAPLSRAASEVGVAFDMDRSAAKFLTQLRRELRQSGFNVSTNTISVDGTTGALTFRMRRSFGDDLATDWDPPITYRLEASPHGAYPDGSPRFRLVRVQGVTSVALEDVQSCTFTLVTGANSVAVNLVLARTNPNWRGSGSPLIVRRYGEAVEYLNKPQ